MFRILYEQSAEVVLVPTRILCRWAPKTTLAALLVTIACALPALAQSDETAKRFHVLPHIADGGGWQSILLVTNVSPSASPCTLQLYGGLDVERFEAAAGGVTAAASTATFELPASGGNLVWRTRNELAVVSGYATLDCVNPVVAQVLFARIDGGMRPTAMATVFSSQTATVFQFPLLTPAATLGFAIANDTHFEASCRIRLVDPQGTILGEAMLSVPMQSNKAQSLYEAIAIPGTFLEGSAKVQCDQPVAMIGLYSELREDGRLITFTTLPPAVVDPTMPSSDETAKNFHVLPHIADGGGWQSILLVTNVSPSASPCTLQLYGGLDVERFEAAGGVTAAASTATFELPASGGNLVWRTRNELAVASGYATLDCVNPVVAQVLFARVGGGMRPTAMATVFSSPAATGFQFPVLTPAATLGFAIANDANSEASCRIRLVDPQGTILGEAMLSVPMQSNKAQSLYEAIAIPGTFLEGSAKVECDQPVVMIGLYSELREDGGLITFTTLPPAVIDDGHSVASGRSALEALYEATGGPNWLNNDNWLTDAPLGEWFGVETDASGRVVWLDLSFNNLTGSIPPEFGYFSRLTTLWLTGNQIDDVSALASMTNLVTLSIGQNNVTDISPLAGLINLTYLSVGDANIEDISPLAGLTNLTDLSILAANIQDEDLSLLSSLTNLSSLALSHNRIADISPLAEMTGLTGLWLWDNQIKDISPLAGLTNLTFLSLGKNNIEVISPLSALTNLTELFLNDNNITDVSPLSGLINLTFLNLSANSISDISPLAGLTDLRELHLSANNITDISPLAGLTNLRNLDLRGNPYETLPKGDFDIELVLLDDFTESEKNVLQYVARRWMSVITEDLPDYEFSEGWSGACGSQSIEISPGDRIDDLRIYVKKERLNVLGFGGPLVVRETTHLPVLGCMGLDLSHANLLITGLHELGHVLGVGSLWRELGYFQNPPGGDQHFNGPLAIAAFDAAGGRDYAGAKVPAEEGHWRGDVFGNELMTPTGTGAISAVTVQSLADLGYVVDVALADPYTLPAAAQASATQAVLIPALIGDGRSSERLPSPTQAKPKVWCSLHGEREPIHVVDQKGRFIRSIDN